MLLDGVKNLHLTGVLLVGIGVASLVSLFFSMHLRGAERRLLLPCIKLSRVDCAFHLRRSGMYREFIQELRGDVRKEAIDIYDHIDKKELREAYLAHIPQLGI